jgi:hypothetical protein
MDAEVAERDDRTKRPRAVVVVQVTVLVILVLIAGHQLDELEVEAAADVPFVDVVAGSEKAAGYILANLINGVDVEGTAREVGTKTPAAVIGRRYKVVVWKPTASSAGMLRPAVFAKRIDRLAREATPVRGGVGDGVVPAGTAVRGDGVASLGGQVRLRFKSGAASRVIVGRGLVAGAY